MIRLGLFAAGVWLGERLPGPLLFGLARLVALVLSAIPSAPRARLRRNLAVVLGVAPRSPVLRRYLREAYQTQVANYVDLLRSRTIAPAAAAQGVIPGGEGWASFERAVAEKRGLVLVTAHFGRIELMTHFLGNRGVHLTLPVERLQPPALFDLLCRLRQRPTFTLVAADLGLRPCLRAIGRGEVVTLFADWDSTGHGVAVEFFGRPARLPAGPALLALRTGAPLIVGFSLPDGPLGADGTPGRRRAVLEPPLLVERSGDFAADVQRATQMMAGVLERYIRQYPGQWVMFHDIWREPAQSTAALACTAGREHRARH
ncbi:MAG TPA: lysophospholipid acyltransferase family protein [Chloroflexota bacterium]|jgi:lauroyl/myristoyl acyltransferase|nr:lysophospholipid acyltransferase family protein [Chloroflexota bacterium]